MTSPSTPKIETRAQFAKRLGVNRSTITRAIQAGRLVIHESGHILVEASLKAWHDSKGHRSDMESRHAQKRGAVIPGEGESVENATAARKTASARQQQRNSNDNMDDGSGLGGSGAAPTPGSRASYKALAMKYENDAIKLQMALRRGQRFPVDDLKREAMGIGGTLRAALERLIDQTAPRLAVLKDPAQRRQLLAAECRAIGRVIRSEFPRALRRMNKAGKA